MLDPSNLLQQEAIGILGVNLIYTAFYELQTKESFLAGLAQDVVKERIEIDYVDLRGPAFESWDRRILPADLVHGGFAEAVLFTAKGPAVPPTEALYKKAVVLAPGIFGHVDSDHAQVHMRLLSSGIEELKKELGDTKAAPAGFFCLTAASIVPGEPVPEIPDLLRRIDALLAAGGDVLLFRQGELYHMTTLVHRYTQAPVRFIAGLSLTIRAFEDIYGNLEGRLSRSSCAALRAERSHLRLSDGRCRAARKAERCFRSGVGNGARQMEWFPPPSCVARHLSATCLTIFSPATFLSLCRFLRA